MAETITVTQTQTRTQPRTERPWLWNVVLLNDDHHTVDFVVKMTNELFGHPEPKGVQIAKKVDKEGRAVLLTTHKELAELKQEQVHSFGRDKLVAECAGSMSAIIEPAEFSGDDDAKDGSEGGGGAG